jgi:pyruvate-ferredoxin/flavodoxin oxidoreductase
MVCPHAALRMKVYAPDALAPLGPTPQGFQSKAFRSKNMAGHLLSVQVSPDDCTGCRVCVEVCPAKSKTDHGHRSLTMAPAGASRAAELANWDFFRSIPLIDRSALPHDSVKGAALLEPLFEFSGACAGCGETPYLRLLSQLFGDRLLIANATGCSSTYGGNLPTTPWAVNAEGRGPAWANSLSEDNAEFGLGIRLGLEAQARLARSLLRSLSSKVGARLAADILEAVQDGEGAIVAQRGRVTELKRRLAGLESGGRAQSAARLASLADCLVRKAVWVVGGDDWACDIGFGGLDQVLASGADVNVLVLDGDVYSNTAGHASKSARHGAVARFASSGQPTPKKDLASMARSYGNVYVAQVAIGANDIHTVKAFLEAEAYEGPSLVIAYATCIHDGIDMAHSMAHQKDAVRLGYWSLYRFHPSERAAMERTLVTEPEHSGPEHAGPAHAGPEPRFPTSQPGSDRNRRNKK